MAFDVDVVRKDFPILERTVRDGRPLVYLDSANTSQKPRAVLDTLTAFYERHNANIHRATHALGEEATEAYETARMKVADFIGAGAAEEVVFVKNSSEALNLVANVLSWGPRAVGPGDEIVITEMEHHSNIVPWQILCERTGARLRWFGVTDDGRLDLDGMDDLLTERTRVLAVVHVSNVLGTVNPIPLLAERAHQVGALVVVDASQSVPHMPVDVAALGADFLAFTGHKMCGPTGIGVLWGRRDLLEELPPFLGGGEMIETVTMEKSTYAAVPHKYEAGTPPIAQAVGLGAAVDYLRSIGMDQIAAHERELTAYALGRLTELPGVRILGPTEAVDRGSAISFVVDGVHPHDVAQVLDAHGVAVRAGHHCGRPIHLRFGVAASTRASSYLYTTEGEIDALVTGLHAVRRFFA
ncbi:cysteine desulfurase [Acidothermus cellulolyticus 11B]|uniref:cysteine desulfurase n=1 Tax=Acidothermus cellulolyticus (strain ATCC 43068 / DSM 8971 / 11B) TaxID=351607 RepID=A0LU00_ACIC1|nr:cysteine desulfurase [Acidothermus cellulolyticus]ABK52910.1 cysteine desulfurase [Acidothermus cellulolyticus 11B]